MEFITHEIRKETDFLILMDHMLPYLAPKQINIKKLNRRPMIVSKLRKKR